MSDWINPPVDIVWAAGLVLLLALILYHRRGQSLLWFTLALGVYIAANQLIRQVIPKANQHFAPGEKPGSAYVLWSDPSFRSDFALVLLVVAVLAVLLGLINRLMRVVDETHWERTGQTAWQYTLSTWSSAAWILFPLIIWIWAALWLIFVGDYTALVLPVLGFLILITISIALWYGLDGLLRKFGLLIFMAVVIIGQLRFNATRPQASMFESNGSVQVYIPLIPVLLGVLIAHAMQSTLPRRNYALLAWKIGTLIWLAAGLGWLVRFLGVYDIQNSYAYDMGSLLETPLKVVNLLTVPYYNLIPREIADDRNVTNMNHWEAVLAFLGGMVALVWISALIQRRLSRLPAGHRMIGKVHLSLQQRRYVLALVLILPAVALRTFTSFYPFLQTIILSVQKYNPAYPPRIYYDFRNFEKLSTNLVVRESIEFTVLFVFVSTFFQVVLGLAIAHLLNANFKLRPLARTISLIPWAIPMVVAAMGFKWMFDDQFGLIPDMMKRLFGYDGKWLIDPENARIAVIFVNIWKSTPFCALLLLAGLQGISLDLYEAAKVDGANWLDSLRFITVPMLMPIVVTVTMFMLVWQLAVFDLPFTMTGGAPGFSTTVVAQKVYLEINSLNYSVASTVSIALVLVVTAIGAIGLYTLRRVEVPA